MRLVTLIAVATATVGVLLFAGDAPKETEKGNEDPFVALVKGTRGCLGVRTANTKDGKRLLFAWFENREAVLRWYHNRMHREIMDKYFGEQKLRKPLEGIKEHTGPVLVVASMTKSDEPIKPFTAFSQLSVELYAPLNGGLFVGGRFSPDSLKVPGLRDLSPRKED